MLRGIVNRAVGGTLLALFIIIVGGCGSSGQAPVTRADTATVSGAVVDGITGLPVVDAAVRIGSIIVHVDRDGGFVVVVPPGMQERSVIAEGYAGYSDTVTVVEGPNDLEAVQLFELPPPPPQF